MNFSWLRRSAFVSPGESNRYTSFKSSLFNTAASGASVTLLLLAAGLASQAAAQNLVRDPGQEESQPATNSTEALLPQTAPDEPAIAAARSKDESPDEGAAASAEAPTAAPQTDAPDKAAQDQPAIDTQHPTASIESKASASSREDETEPAAAGPAGVAHEVSAPADLAPPAPSASGASAGPVTAASESSQIPTKRELAAQMQAALEKLVYSETKGPHAAETQKIHEALAAFYTMRNFAPLWSTDGQETPGAHAIIERLQHAPDDGLDLVFVPELQTGSGEDRVKADLALSEAVIAYARAASGGRIDPKTISPLIGEKPEVAEPFDILSSVFEAGASAGNVLWNYNPPQKGYQALRDKLAELRHEKTSVAHQAIPYGPELKIGMRDPRVTLIRARFGLDVQQATAPADLIYDTRVAAAVADFQKTNGLPASGVLTARTIAALSGGQPSRLENEILANMERWRWLPRDMGSTYIAVNIPDFTVEVIRDDEVLTRHRVVVGKPDTPTPVFSNKMQYLIVNPYWNVPQSIIRKEFLPKMGGDLDALTDAGWQVSSHNGVLTVRQPPGEKNALGRIKFLFPNDYSVYLHDTPSRALFASARRAFSHGCVRVDQPFSFAETVLNHSWTEQRLKSLIGSGERYINLPVPLPIHIEYFTTYVDETGRLQMRDDLYGYSHKVKAALGLEG